MNPASLQQVQARYAQLSPQERLSATRAHIAYIELLDIDHAPTLTISAQPDNPLLDPIELTVTGAEFLADFQALLLARLEKMSQEAALAFRQAGIPAGCTTSELQGGNGVTVTIVHREGPPIATSEAEVMLD